MDCAILNSYQVIRGWYSQNYVITNNQINVILTQFTQEIYFDNVITILRGFCQQLDLGNAFEIIVDAFNGLDGGNTIANISLYSA